MTTPLDTDLLARAATDEALEHSAVRLLVHLCAQLRVDRWTVIKNTARAAELGMKRETVGAQLRVLVERGYLIQGPLRGSCRTYRLPHTERVHELAEQRRIA